MPKVTLLVFAFLAILAIWGAEILLGFNKKHFLKASRKSNSPVSLSTL